MRDFEFCFEEIDSFRRIRPLCYAFIFLRYSLNLLAVYFNYAIGENVLIMQ